MKASRPQNPARWGERDADRHALEARAALLADAASQVQSVAPDAFARILGEVVARRPVRDRWLVLGWSFRTRLALGLAVLIVCLATASGAGILWRRHVAATRAPAASPVPAETKVERAHGRAPRAPTPTNPAGLPVPPPDVPSAAVSADARLARSDETAPKSALTPSPARALALSSAPPSSPPVAAAGSAPLEPPPFAPRPIAHGPVTARAPGRAPTMTEAALLAEALSALRRQDDPRAALATLDRHARAFPQARLGSEAFRTRVEALVRLGDHSTTLALLDGAGEAAALDADLVLTRAELRAGAGRFRDALADFTAALEGASGPLAATADERALYGRAVCLARLTHFEEARADLRAYERRFPDGRFAGEVRRLLAGDISSPGP